MVLDSNILIDYLLKKDSVVQALDNLKQKGQVFFISSVSVAELLALPDLTLDDAFEIKNFLRNFISVPFDDELAESAGIIKRTYGLKIPDAAIAATALIRRVPLATNDRQFQKIKEITVVGL